MFLLLGSHSLVDGMESDGAFGTCLVVPDHPQPPRLLAAKELQHRLLVSNDSVYVSLRGQTLCLADAIPEGQPWALVYLAAGHKRMRISTARSTNAIFLRIGSFGASTICFLYPGSQVVFRAKGHQETITLSNDYQLVRHCVALPQEEYHAVTLPA